jgi:hypothetical protein
MCINRSSTRHAHCFLTFVINRETKYQVNPVCGVLVVLLPRFGYRIGIANVHHFIGSPMFGDVI